MFGLRTKRVPDAEFDADRAARNEAKRVAAIMDTYDHLLDEASPTLNCITLLPAPKPQLKAYLLEARTLDKKGGSHEALEEAYIALATFQQLTPEQREAADHCDFLDELLGASRRDAELESPKLKAKLLRYSEAMELLGPVLDKVGRESKRLAADWNASQV
jgi:hypothetical protein